MQNLLCDIVILGAGPAGLACAIEARKAGLHALVLEQGSVVDAIRRFPQNMVWFSTPELLSIGDVPFVISTVRPTRVDTLNYYQKVVTYFNLDVRSHDPVTAVKRTGQQFEVLTVHGKTYQSPFVIVATGYFDHPNRLNVPGEDRPHVLHYYSEPHRYFGCDVVVVGGRNSAVEAALDLYRHGARVTLIHRQATFSPGVKYWILPDIENRIKAQEIQVLFDSEVVEILERSVVVLTRDQRMEVAADFLFILVGFLPDSERLRSFGMALDPETLAPQCNPETLETTVPGLFVAGSVVAGRNTNKIFVENGRLHSKAIVATITRRLSALSPPGS